MRNDPLGADALGFLDDALTDARAVLARAVDRTDAIAELRQIAAEMQAELRHPPTLAELLDHHATETERARVRALLTRSSTEGAPQ